MLSTAVSVCLSVRAVKGERVELYMERKCADTTGTVPVPWAGHFSMLKYKYDSQTKYTEAIYQTALGNCYGLKLATR